MKKNDMLFKKVFTFLSLCVNHSALFASDCLNRVLNYPLFNDFHKFYLWSDGGPHFHNNLFINSIFLNSNFGNKIFEYNFFCEKHGKSVCDQFFGNMSGFLRRYRMKQGIENINQLIACLANNYSSSDSEYFFEMFLLIFYLFFLNLN
jgi:hypothetical protein